ncbi:hypothetical protein [Scytonema sp. PCC 10023]
MKAPNFQVAIMYFRTPERMKKPVFPSAFFQVRSVDRGYKTQRQTKYL